MHIASSSKNPFNWAGMVPPCCKYFREFPPKGNFATAKGTFLENRKLYEVLQWFRRAPAHMLIRTANILGNRKLLTLGRKYIKALKQG